MARGALTRVLPNPVDVVWETLADFGGISRWGRGVDQSNLLTVGPAGEGSVRRVQVGRTALREAVVVFEPGSTLGYTITGLPAVVTHAQNTWRLEPMESKDVRGAPAGERTRVTLTADVTTRPPFLAPIVVRVVGRANAGLLAGLADHLQGVPA